MPRRHDSQGPTGGIIASLRAQFHILRGRRTGSCFAFAARERTVIGCRVDSHTVPPVVSWSYRDA